MLASRQSHLLIVEEEATLADVTAFRLELLGFSVEVARSGEEALSLVRQRKPDLMIIDKAAGSRRCCLDRAVGQRERNRGNSDIGSFFRRGARTGATCLHRRSG